MRLARIFGIEINWQSDFFHAGHLAAGLSEFCLRFGLVFWRAHAVLRRLPLHGEAYCGVEGAPGRQRFGGAFSVIHSRREQRST